MGVIIILSSVNNTMQKPVNSFLLFCKEHRSTVQTENPGYSNADVTSHLGKMWRSMRKEQKEKYVQRSRAISQKFKKENPRYIREPKEFEQYQFSFKVQSQGATKTTTNICTSYCKCSCSTTMSYSICTSFLSCCT